MIGRDRLLFEHIERSARDFAGAYSIGKIALYDQPASRAVNQIDSVFHLLHRRPVNYSPRLLCERGVQSDEVRAKKKLIQSDHIDSQFARRLFGEVRIVNK